MTVASFIASQRTEHGVPHAKCCRWLGVSESWFYKWHDREPTAREQRRAELDAAVRAVAERRRGRLDDAGVCLVGHEQVNVSRAHPGAREHGRRGLGHPVHGVAVDLAALHPDQPALVGAGLVAFAHLPVDW